MILEFTKKLDEQINNISELIKTVKKALVRVPKGTIYAFRSHGQMEYQLVGDDKKRKYLPKKNERLIRALLQKNYDKKLLAALEKNLAGLTKMKKLADPGKLPALFDDLPEEWKLFIDDRGISDEEYVKRWAAEPYEHKEIRGNVPEFVTNHGERVRSKSEKIIADMLNEKGLAYRYEEPLILSGLGTIHTDFKILHPRRRVVICMEHNGRMDDPEYAERATKRIIAYERNGYYEGDRLLLTFETSTSPLDTEMLSKKLDHFFFD